MNQALMEETLIKQQQEMEEDQRWLEQEESHMVMKLTQKADFMSTKVRVCDHNRLFSLPSSKNTKYYPDKEISHMSFDFHICYSD